MNYVLKKGVMPFQLFYDNNIYFNDTIYIFHHMHVGFFFFMKNLPFQSTKCYPFSRLPTKFPNTDNKFQVLHKLIHYPKPASRF